MPDAVVCAAVAGLPALARLSLRHCEQLSDNTVRMVACSTPSLTHLDLCLCTAVTDDGMSCVTRFLTRLTHLDTTCCSVTHDAFVGLNASLSLTTLIVEGESPHQTHTHVCVPHTPHHHHPCRLQGC